MSFAHSPQIVTNGLVLALDAGNTKSYVSGSTTWFDKSGYANNGTLTNGPTFSSANGGSIVFDGTNDYVDCGNNSSIQLIGDMTIVSWIKVTNFSNFNGIIGKTNNNLAGPYDYYLYQSTGIPYFWRGNGNINNRVEGTNPPIVNVWQQVAVTMLGTSVVHYLNGNTNGSGTLSTTIANTNNNLRIGNRTDNVTPFRGNIASVQIYNQALSASEVQQNFNALRGRFGI